MEGVADPLLEIRGLKTYFYTRDGVVPAVDDVHIEVGRGEIVGIVGESGCGKSVTSLSVLQLVAAPGKVVAGEVKFQGEDILVFTKKRMRALRGNEISMIFQEPMTSLNPVYTVGRQVAEVLRIHESSLNAEEMHAKVVELFSLVGIPEPERRVHAYPHQLSGGLRQRIMIAMALIRRPKLLIADEPTTALDVTIEAQIFGLIKKLRKEFDTSIILITHNLGVVAETCDRVYVMYAGKVVEEAEVFELFGHPKHPYTSGLLQSIPRKNQSGRKDPGKRLYCIRGSVPNMLRLPRGCKFAPRCDCSLPICHEKEPELVRSGAGHQVRCWKYADRGGEVA